MTTQVRVVAIPNRGAYDERNPALYGGSGIMWHHKVAFGGRAERTVTKADQSLCKELSKINICTYGKCQVIEEIFYDG